VLFPQPDANLPVTRLRFNCAAAVAAIILLWLPPRLSGQSNAGAEAFPPPPQLVIKTPRISQEVRLNPGKGWVLYGNDPTRYSPDLLALATVGYDLNEWCWIEPKPGVFDWNWFDYHLREWNERGKQFAFGIECANGSGQDLYTTSKWVFDRGAKSYTIHSSESGATQVIPQSEDPIFLRELAKMTKAIGDHYDANPHLAYIDIRRF
jgi:hypothetical protein